MNEKIDVRKEGGQWGRERVKGYEVNEDGLGQADLAVLGGCFDSHTTSKVRSQPILGISDFQASVVFGF